MDYGYRDFDVFAERERERLDEPSNLSFQTIFDLFSSPRLWRFELHTVETLSWRYFHFSRSSNDLGPFAVYNLLELKYEIFFGVTAKYFIYIIVQWSRQVSRNHLNVQKSSSFASIELLWYYFDNSSTELDIFTIKYKLLLTNRLENFSPINSTENSIGTLLRFDISLETKKI